MMPEPIVLSWSGGKDSALALAALADAPEWEVVALLTTVTAGHERISMHGVRRSLLHAQAESLGLPLIEAAIPPAASNEIYEAAMGEAFDRLREDGECDPPPSLPTLRWARGLCGGEGMRRTPIRSIAFGDLFLEDVRVYRERLAEQHGLAPVFPLWGRDTRELAREFIDRGFVAHLACIDPRALEESFAGRRYDHALLADLPAGVDPCGENGEFHTFVSDGPIFDRPIPVECGEIVRRGSFVFRDLLLNVQPRRSASPADGSPFPNEVLR